jgi:hypothetical protein
MTRYRAFLCGLILLTAAADAAEPVDSPTDLAERLLDRIVAGEQDFLLRMQSYQPFMEIYLQSADDGSAGYPGDQYAMGRVRLDRDGVGWTRFAASDGFVGKDKKSLMTRMLGDRGLLARGFAQMIVPDAFDFNRVTYDFTFQRREFLGSVRTLVFEVQPRSSRPGKFVGRIWVEEEGARLVRFNGTYTGSNKKDIFFHFDSWRVHAAGDFWAPAFVYIQDEDETGALGARFAAQARLWNYSPARSDEVDALTAILVEQADVDSQGGPEELTPLEAERKWQEESQRNVLRRLEQAGLLAPRGPLDEVAEIVVGNLMAANGIAPDIECRILLTAPLETFSIGQAIVISRGLIDVLPDEASLAMALSPELAHAVLGHRMDTMYAFGDLTMFEDAEILDRLRLGRPAEEVSAASAKAVDLLEKSSYADKLMNAGLLLKALESHAPRLPQLIRSNFGNAVASEERMARLEVLAGAAPELDEESLEQIAALPLGSRVRLDPWSNQVSLRTVKPAEIRTADDKLPFKVTPFLINLKRVGE